MCFQVATFIPFVMMLKAEFRARFNSVERVCQYANVSTVGVEHWAFKLWSHLNYGLVLLHYSKLVVKVLYK